MMKLTKSSRVFRRAMAFVLAAAMTLSAPVATQASAASKKKVPTLSVKKKTLYYNKSGKSSFTLKVKKNKVKKIVKTKWTTSKKSIVKISAKKKTSVKVTAKKKGSAKITAKVTYKVGAKTKTKKLTCKVTSKKKTTPAPATETPVVSGTPATDAPTEVPATDVPATDVPATDVPATPEPTAEPTAEPTEEPAAVVANVEKVSAIDPSDFAVTLTFANPAGEVTEDIIKNAKLTFVKDSISVTASYAKIDEQGSAVFKIDDSKALRPGNRTADGNYSVTSSSANLVLGADAKTTTYEEALAGMAVEGYVTRWNANNSAANKYEAVPGAVVSIKGGKSATTDAEGYYRIATTAGKKTLSVEADGYRNQTTDTGAVSINRNHPTAHNFVLSEYNVNNVYLKIQAVDSQSEATMVMGATVKLKDAAGNVVAGTNTLTTDSNGKAIFANNAVSNTVIDGWTANVPSKQKANTNPAQVFLQRNTTYTVELEKKLTGITPGPANLTDVYKVATAEVKIGGEYDNEVIVRMIKVAKLPSMTITQTYAASTSEGTSAAVLANNATEAVYNTYQLLTDLNGDKVADALTAPVEFTSQINNSRVTAPELIANIPALNNATLPTGKYYVLIKGYTTAAATTPTATAYAVVEVDVTEGVAATAAVTRTIGCTRELTTNIGLTEINAKPQETTVPGPSATSGSALKSIAKNTAYPDYTATAHEVNANNKLYQVMTGDVLVEVETSGELIVRYTDKKTYSAKNEYTHILGAAKYCIKTASNYSKAADWTFEANNIINAQHTIDSDSKWSLVKVRIKAQTGDELVGKAVPALAKIRVLDGNGAEKYAKVYSPELATITGGSPANGEYVEYTIAVSELQLMDAGDYKIEATLKNCLPVTSAVTKAVGLEELTATIDEKVMPATSSDVTTVAGTVSINMNNGKVVKANGTIFNPNPATSDKATQMLVQIVALKDGKIAGIATTDANGRYEIKDGVNGTKLGAGTYTLVARSQVAETTVATITLTDKQNLTQDIVMNEGADGSIKAIITNTNNNAIGAHFKAYDAYYVDPSVAGNWVNNVKGTVPSDTLAGTLGAGYGYGAYRYNGEFADENVMIHNGVDISTTEREAKGLSAGTYTLKFSNASDYNMPAQSVTLQDVGQKAYPEYQFSPNAEPTGSGKVDLTVKHGIPNTGNYVVVVKREDGNTEAIKYIAQGPGYTPTANYTVMQVTTNQTYEVKVYNIAGNYVASNKAVVQSVASDVTVAFDIATVD